MTHKWTDSQTDLRSSLIEKQQEPSQSLSSSDKLMSSCTSGHGRERKKDEKVTIPDEARGAVR